ncbi:hypothetical protein DFH09DRAFT_1286614 [Mycena vulgaris]|nr:hypothetical protein DFH09DRAFT_1286614 [Mycena vulgaris]
MLHHSPFAEKLNTNYVPSDVEIDEIYALLVAPLGELARLDTQIDEAQAFLDELRVKRQFLKVEIDSHTALTSSVRRLPQEMLQEIFLACVPTQGGPLSAVAAREAPLLLGFVCRYWRSVAHSMPLLWSSFHIQWGMGRAGGRELDAWLTRAGTCPLSISLHFLEYYSNASCDEVIGLIMKACRRIERLALVGEVFRPSLSPLLHLGAEDLPALTSLTIDTRSYVDGLPIFRAPGLRDISLEAPVNPLGLPLVWGQLTDLTLGPGQALNPPHGLDFDGAVELFSRCQNLVRAHLHLWGYSRTTPRSALARPHLQHLTLVLDIPSDPFALLQFLSFPNLRQLAIFHAQDPASDPRASLPTTPPSPASGTPHLSVDVSLRHFTQGTLLTLLALVPRVTRLRLRGTRETLDGGFLSRLTPVPNSEGHLCPALTHLEISAYCVFSDAALLDFIRSRSRTIHAHDPPSEHAPRLEQIHIAFNRSMRADILPELAPLIEEGLSVELVYTRWWLRGGKLRTPLQQSSLETPTQTQTPKSSMSLFRSGIMNMGRGDPLPVYVTPKSVWYFDARAHPMLPERHDEKSANTLAFRLRKVRLEFSGQVKARVYLKVLEVHRLDVIRDIDVDAGVHCAREITQLPGIEFPGRLEVEVGEDECSLKQTLGLVRHWLHNSMHELPYTRRIFP